jgi:interleukin-1 receptor-associated kinase 1
MDTVEDEIARRMAIVGLWCIQTFPSDRPTMSKVIEMLEVSMNLLEKPPKPLLSSPTRSSSESVSS